MIGFALGPWTHKHTGYIPGAWWIRDGNNKYVGEAINEADARLMASAPAIYEALQDAVRWIDEVTGSDDFYAPSIKKKRFERLQTALALADGEKETT